MFLSLLQQLGAKILKFGNLSTHPVNADHITFRPKEYKVQMIVVVFGSKVRTVCAKDRTILANHQKCVKRVKRLNCLGTRNLEICS